MPYTTPKTWASGDVLTAADLNTYVRDNVAFGANPPKCRAFNSADQTIAIGGNFTFDSESWDTDTMHSPATNPERITFTTAGLYVITGRVWLNFGSTAGFHLGLVHQRGATAITLDADEKPGLAGLFLRYSLQAQYQMQAGDFVFLKNESGITWSSKAMRGGPALEAVRVGI